MTFSRFVPLLLVAIAPVFAASPLQEKVRAWRVAHERAIIDEYRAFVSIPNLTIDRANIRRNADFLLAAMKARGIEARLLTIASPNSNPVVYGEVKVPGATKTVMLYAHFDGQPVNPKEWAPGWEPFAPKFVTASAEKNGRLIENWKSGDPIDPSWRLTGRGAADDKAGVMTILNAYAALTASGAVPSANLKFFFDGEEELGSPNLGAVIEAHREALRADLWIILDGPTHPSGKKVIAFGVRGDVNMSLTVFGPKRPLHSGNYGNWAPNPSWQLVRLLATMKDDDGRVLIKGFYDDVIPLTPAEKAAVAAIPSAEDELQRDLGIARPEVAGRSVFEGFNLPTLNINGIQGANVGAQAANVIPTVARAALDLRLVPGNDAQRQIQKVVAHIQAQGWRVIDHDPSDEERLTNARLVRIDTKSAGNNAQRTPLDSPIAQTVIAAVQSTVDYPVVLMPSLGGTLPLITIEQMLGTKLLTVPIVNFDNNQHAENENVKVQSLWDGLETYAALMTMK